MSFSEYLLGAVELAVIAASLCIGAYSLRALLVPSWTGAPARLAEAIIAITGMVVVAEVVGVIGLFEPGFLVLGSVLLSGGVVAFVRGRTAPGDRPLPPAPAPGILFLIAGLLAAALVVVHWAMPTQQALDIGMYSQDTVWYHMSFAGRFFQDSQVGPILITDPLKVVSWFYPANSELLHGVGIAAFGHDNLSPLVNLGWLALCLLAGWCVGRPYGLAPLTLIGTAIVLDTPMMVEQAGNAPSDTITLFFLLAALAILVNADAAAAAADGGRRALAGRLAGIGTGPVILAGLAAGLAIGTKITMLATVGVLSLALLYLAQGDRLRFAWIWIASVAVPSVFWYIRNTVETGNPLPWAQKGPLPGPDQLDLYPRKPHTVFHYATDTGVWKDWFFPALDDRLGPLWVVLLVGCVGGLLLLVWKGRSPLQKALGLVGLVAVGAYVFTPLGAAGAEGSPSGFAPNLRYFSPGFAAGLVLLPLALPLASKRAKQIALGALVAALLVGTIVQIAYNAPAYSAAEIAKIATEGQSGFRSFAQESYDWGKLPGALLLAAVLVGIPFALAVPGGRTRRTILGAGSVALVFLVVGLGYAQSRDYVKDRYDTSLANPFERESGFRATPEWKQLQEWGRAQEDTDIGVVGRAAAFGQYVFYGPDISNHVDYISSRIAKGGSRPIDSCGAWRRAVNDGGYQYVVITPRFGDEATAVPPEIGWTAKDPGVSPVIANGPSAVFKIDKPLDPAGCAPATA
jgi:hypothetical protein